MDTSVLIVIMSACLMAAFIMGRGKSLAAAPSIGGVANLNSLPFYYGMLAVLWAGLPAIGLLFLWALFQSEIIEMLVIQQLPESLNTTDKGEISLLVNQIQNVAAGKFSEGSPDYIIQAADKLNQFEAMSRWLIAVVVMIVMVVGGAMTWLRITPEMKARLGVERAFKNVLLTCSCIAILTTVGIVLSVLFESIRFFKSVPITEFIFGLEWSPQNAMRKDQVTGESSFGAVPLFAGTLLIALIAMLVAVPTGLMAAIYLSEYASKKVRAWVKPALEVLAGIPTVVYGFIAAITVAPFIRDAATAVGLHEYMNVTSESALAAWPSDGGDDYSVRFFAI